MYYTVRFMHLRVRCSVLQCVAVCCSAFYASAWIHQIRIQCWPIEGYIMTGPRHVSVCCSVLQCVAVCCSVLQCGAVCCSVLQCVAVCCSVAVLQCVAVCCSVLQCVAVCCSVLQCMVPMSDMSTTRPKGLFSHV